MSVTVAAAVANPELFAPGNRTDAENDYVSIGVTATNPNGGQLVFTATGLPPGILIRNATGELFGWLTTDSAGSYTPQISVADGLGGSDTASFTWTVTGVNQAPFIVPLPSQLYAVNATLSNVAIFTASDPDADALTITVTGLPTGLTYDAPSRTISGTVLQAGTVSVMVTANDGNGGEVSATFPVLTAGLPFAYFTAQGPLVADAAQGTPVEIEVAFSNAANPNTYYDIAVGITGPGSVDESVLSMKDGDTTTITYTPLVASLVWNDVVISLTPQLTAPAISQVTAKMDVVNILVTLPDVNAATTPANMSPRVSLGADQIGSFSGQGTVTPAKLPEGITVSLYIDKPIPDIKYGDISIKGGEGLVKIDDKGHFPVVISGFNPTLPTSDYKAGNKDGLGIKAIVSGPGGISVVVKGPNKFSVATIPISVIVTKVAQASPTFVVSTGQYVLGAITNLAYSNDGTTGSSDYNYTGEWVQFYMNNNLTNDMNLNGTTNFLLSPSGPVTDFNGPNHHHIQTRQRAEMTRSVNSQVVHDQMV